jgi:hypothetical protein
MEHHSTLHIAKINGFPCSLISKLGVEWNVMNNGVEPLTVPMHVGFHRALAPLRLMSESWQALFLEVLDCPPYFDF